ncbi:RNA polymerase sigma factor sigD [Hibiscus syriacus]|uniref:RNA polymerase sigma factor sigD n=1 Tax=Hibiscus syriacus TaxID=106335 RepID=A0A6A3AVQ8_HIBSY|nr:RNA polymerase sigma factor sigD [Hibiscus syriacus]
MHNAYYPLKKCFPPPPPPSSSSILPYFSYFKPFSPQPATPPTTGENVLSSKTLQPPNQLVESSRPHDPDSLNYVVVNPNTNSLLGLARTTESNIEKTIFDFRFMALFAIGAYKVYWTSCVKGIHTGNMVLRLVEAIDAYLAGTVMLIFGMGLYGLFISNLNPELPTDVDRALKGSSLFGMFAMKERPKWMKISSLDELKTKVGHVIV